MMWPLSSAVLQADEEVLARTGARPVTVFAATRV
jgi:hypothetical protein